MLKRISSLTAFSGSLSVANTQTGAIRQVRRLKLAVSGKVSRGFGGSDFPFFSIQSSRAAGVYRRFLAALLVLALFASSACDAQTVQPVAEEATNISLLNFWDVEAAEAEADWESEAGAAADSAAAIEFYPQTMGAILSGQGGFSCRVLSRLGSRGPPQADGWLGV